MNPFALLLSPWTWLAIIIYSLALFAYGEHDGSERGEARITAAWEASNRIATEARQKRIDANRALMAANEAKAKQERIDYAKRMETMRGNLRIALNGLRDRPARPSVIEVPANAVAAGPGADQRCTGAGLYRDDAEFLTWRADAAQRIRVQRDSCYRAYEAAQATVSKVQCQ